MEPNDAVAPVPAEGLVPVSRLPLMAMGAVVALAILMAIAIGLRSAPDYPPDSPEAALQAFLQAGLDGDEDRVIAALIDDAQDRCDRQLRRDGSNRTSSGTGFELDRIMIDGTAATADVTLRESDTSDPFDGTLRRLDLRFELVEVDGEWLVSEAEWPWWIQACLRRP